MADHTVETSPQIYARIGGILYLYIIVAGTLGQLFVRDKLIVSGDAEATANNIIASQLLWRTSIAAELIMLVCSVPPALIFYLLFRPVSKNLAMLAVFFNLVELAIDAANKLNLFAALFLLGGAGYLKALEPRQLRALAYLPLKLHDYGFAISLVFFAFVCLILGYLLFRSGYFPKTLGVLMTVAGLSYLTNSFTLLLAPTYSAMVLPILVLAFIGEMSFCLWLIVKGVNVSKWKHQASAGRARG
jgi:uncharacterized protein DUF4386